MPRLLPIASRGHGLATSSYWRQEAARSAVIPDDPADTRAPVTGTTEPAAAPEAKPLRKARKTDKETDKESQSAKRNKERTKEKPLPASTPNRRSGAGKSLHRPPEPNSNAKAKATQKPEEWQVQKAALKEKFPQGWKPRKRLSPDALAGIRALNAQFPDMYTTRALADKFEVSVEAIRRILKSKWTPSVDEEQHRQERWFRRGMQVWERKAAVGVKPPRKWRREGIVRDVSWHERRKEAARREMQWEEEERAAERARRNHDARGGCVDDVGQDEDGSAAGSGRW
ncbi:Neugrin-related protein [Metarhizium album ARSEF 1941]|uniref:Required for respiratory growth protein 9, mitochondrial n=1 Tax=Metarhizium album (strain ARSEF 1941) TaxID=1081103 RepID=A0A0B2WXZ9_METAS|nr:Neugrin-related protein [Metarhizium album ARSEF 1941]KHN98262.1 Neugrin-related protein [Metarhizium album ARSEF 1941]